MLPGEEGSDRLIEANGENILIDGGAFLVCRQFQDELEEWVRNNTLVLLMNATNLQADGAFDRLYSGCEKDAYVFLAADTRDRFRPRGADRAFSVSWNASRMSVASVAFRRVGSASFPYEILEGCPCKTKG